MALSSKNAAKLAKALKTKFGVTGTAAKNAINHSWMMLACTDVHSWRSVRLSQYDNTRVSVFDGERYIAHLVFPKGSLPLTPTESAWAEYDAALAGVLPANDNLTITGQIIAASISTQSPRCVDVTIERQDGGTSTAIMLPFLSEGEQLLAYALEQVGVPAKLIMGDERFSDFGLPAGVDPETPVLEMIIPRSIIAFAA